MCWQQATVALSSWWKSLRRNARYAAHMRVCQKSNIAEAQGWYAHSQTSSRHCVYKVTQDCIILPCVPACLPFCMPACLLACLAFAPVQAVASCKVESLYVRGLALDPENKFWATASADGTVQVWELQAGAMQSTEETRKKIAPQVCKVCGVGGCIWPLGLAGAKL